MGGLCGGNKLTGTNFKILNEEKKNKLDEIKQLQRLAETADVIEYIRSINFQINEIQQKEKTMLFQRS